MRHLIAGTVEAEKAAVDKWDDVMEHGPRLTYSSTWIVARCPSGKHHCIDGLGSLGVGQMWFGADPDDVGRPELETVPIAQCGNSECGCTGTEIHGHLIMVKP